jgi:hypothetical protein
MINYNITMDQIFTFKYMGGKGIRSIYTYIGNNTLYTSITKALKFPLKYTHISCIMYAFMHSIA